MGTHANFKMPVLTDDDWEKILTNVNVSGINLTRVL